MTRQPVDPRNDPQNDRTRAPEPLEPQDAHGLPGYPGRAAAVDEKKPAKGPANRPEPEPGATEPGNETPEQDNEKIG
ncbi:hypothetical protein [Pseudomonas chlororaphis]|uniref:hypothetical protein n=1 Tax=Pseudomonas chlororaphis TaxID=587753 RepID=UPI000F5561F4|nr:hypothetical protein [Pseudomonas chlororaphis]AZD48658.1 hypothetical protein C4K20_3243 [Pseudomonas chlororaphis subsp. aurantiaca]